MTRDEIQKIMGISEGIDVIAFINAADTEWLNLMAAEVIMGWKKEDGFYWVNDEVEAKASCWFPSKKAMQSVYLMKKCSTVDCYPRFFYDPVDEVYVADVLIHEQNCSDVEYDGYMCDLYFESDDDYSCLVKACLAAFWLNADKGESDD